MTELAPSVSVEPLPGTPGSWLVRMSGRAFAAQVVILVGERVELPGAVELLPPSLPSPYEAALSALFPPGSRASWDDVGFRRVVSVVSSPSFDRRSVSVLGGERDVHVRELRPC